MASQKYGHMKKCVLQYKLDRGCPNGANTPAGTIFQGTSVTHEESACEVS